MQVKITGKHAAFLVDGKTFAYYLSDYQGDGIIGVCCRTRSGEAPEFRGKVASQWFTPANPSLKGWTGLRLDRMALDWGEVSDLIRGSYFRSALLAV
ncbi:hypothetical protein ACPOL_3954 [Acidisarcina polymorpha]|uniref:Uncharacterized protein n=1 Tax=Acidisarcina polymorpha TaxID=2211140 RepID=A0A2Z5G236_9BACT|nr:hypothetical protein ACPOL_3954 [Acidisarcina polymorpha]